MERGGDVTRYRLPGRTPSTANVRPASQLSNTRSRMDELLPHNWKAPRSEGSA